MPNDWRALLVSLLISMAMSPAHAQYRYGRRPTSESARPLALNRSSALSTQGFSASHYAYGNYGAPLTSSIGVTPIQPRLTTQLPAVLRMQASAPTTIAPIASVGATSPIYLYAYGVYGFPSTYFQPTVQSYLPYGTPGNGYSPGQAPVFAVTYAGGATLGQSSTGASNSSPTALNAQLGYPSYVNNRGSFGQDFFPGLAPGQVSYGQSTQAASTPLGYYGNYIAPAGATYEQIISGTVPPNVGLPLGPPPLPIPPDTVSGR
jgi:hypothetical protein